MRGHAPKIHTPVPIMTKVPISVAMGQFNNSTLTPKQASALAAAQVEAARSGLTPSTNGGGN